MTNNDVKTLHAKVYDVDVCLTIGYYCFDQYAKEGERNDKRVVWTLKCGSMTTVIKWNDISKSTGWDEFMKTIENTNRPINATAYIATDFQGYQQVYMKRDILEFRRTQYGNDEGGDGEIQVSLPYSSTLLPCFKELHRIRLTYP